MSDREPPKPRGFWQTYQGSIVRGAVMALTGAVLAPVLGPLSPAVALAVGASLGGGDDAGAGPDLG